MYLAEEIQNKWAPVLDHPDLGSITNAHKRSVTAMVLENTEKAMRESGQSYTGQSLLGESFADGRPGNSMGASSSTASDGAVDIFDPVLISLVRRAMPNLIAYDICGVQPMTGPTGLIFAMRARYSNNNTGDETFYNEVNTAFSTVVSGANTFGNKNVGTFPGDSNTTNLSAVNTYNFGAGMSTSQAEALGNAANVAMPEMAFSIEKVTVTAKSRALKAEYTMELAQDLKAVHGLDAETELSNILSAEILAEINREVVRTVNITATAGATEGTTTTGIFDLDTDSNGRWSVEKFKGLMFQVEREANQISKSTRRGKGNMIICSSDVASAIQMAGVLNGRMRVYIDPYAIGGNYMTVGYKGSSAFDAGLFYCPYVPLQMVRAVDPGSFQPKIGFKTRYGMVANPFADGATAAGTGALTINSNVYYRRVTINNIM